MINICRQNYISFMFEMFDNTIYRPTEIENIISNKTFDITTWLHNNKLKLNGSK